MAETHFERLVKAEMATIQRAAMLVSLGDPLKGACDLARLQGRYMAFEQSMEMQRKAGRTDTDRDDI